MHPYLFHNNYFDKDTLYRNFYISVKQNTKYLYVSWQGNGENDNEYPENSLCTAINNYKIFAET